MKFNVVVGEFVAANYYALGYDSIDIAREEIKHKFQNPRGHQGTACMCKFKVVSIGESDEEATN